MTKKFLRLKSHFLFQQHFCLVRRANEKGHVERLLDFARTNYLVPVPGVVSLVDLNATLLQRCQADLDRQLYGKPAPKAVLLEEERPALLPIPSQEFEARRIKRASVNSLSLARFDTNDYSVPVRYAHRKLIVVATVEEVRLVYEDRLVARHRRCWDREWTFFEPIHYLALLERKPGGFDYARPLEGMTIAKLPGIPGSRLP